MPDSDKPTAAFLQQLRTARRAETEARAAGRRALSATYDRATGRIVMELTNGSIFGFVARRVPGIAGLTDAELAQVTLSPGGSGLAWDDLDIHLSVAGIILDSLDPKAARSELARIAGKSRSSAKAAASRANGKKGGRPRKRPAALKTTAKAKAR